MPGQRQIAAHGTIDLPPSKYSHAGGEDREYRQRDSEHVAGAGNRQLGHQLDHRYSCGEQAKRVCTGRLPFFLDVQPSFGFAEHWDVIVDLRFGIEADFTQSHQLAVAPGVRYWVDNDAQTKFYATIQGVIDATAQNNTAVRGTDVGFRNANGFMFDVMRNFAVYLQFGETIGFVRWLRFEIDAGVGVQVRIP